MGACWLGAGISLTGSAKETPSTGTQESRIDEAAPAVATSDSATTAAAGEFTQESQLSTQDQAQEEAATSGAPTEAASQAANQPHNAVAEGVPPLAGPALAAASLSISLSNPACSAAEQLPGAGAETGARVPLRTLPPPEQAPQNFFGADFEALFPAELPAVHKPVKRLPQQEPAHKEGTPRLPSAMLHADKYEEIDRQARRRFVASVLDFLLHVRGAWSTPRVCPQDNVQEYGDACLNVRSEISV